MLGTVLFCIFNEKSISGSLDKDIIYLTWTVLFVKRLSEMGLRIGVTDKIVKEEDEFESKVWDKSVVEKIEELGKIVLALN